MYPENFPKNLCIGSHQNASSAQSVYQNVWLLAKRLPNHSLKHFFTLPPEQKTEKNKYQLWIILDQLQDPSNIGAIIRTSATLGVTGIVVDDRCTPDLSQAMAKSASGGLEHVDIYRVSNISESIKILQKNNVWCYALCESGTGNLEKMVQGSHVALIFGQEGDGVRNHVKEVCDGTIVLDTMPLFSTLNVSCTVAIAGYMTKKSQYI